MRYVACTNVDCANHGAPYHDDEPDETIVLCPLCEKTMPATTLEALAQVNAEKFAARDVEEAKATAAAAAEAAANPPSAPVDPLAALKAMPPDRVVTASELLAIFSPEDLDAHTADLGLQEENLDA